MDRVLPSEGRGCWFDPSRARQGVLGERFLRQHRHFFALRRVHCRQGRQLRLLAHRVDDLVGIVHRPHQHPVRVLDFIASLERATGRAAKIEFAPMQPGDVPMTCADPQRLMSAIGDWPATSLDDGLARFVHWLAAWDPLPTS